MAFDAGRGVTVLFGGGYDDTWEYVAPCGTGDFNDDGAVTLSTDLPVFVSMLLAPPVSCNADMNHDGTVDGRDISLCVAALIGP